MTAITVTDLTTGVVDGTGVFDGLMKATNAHIQVEYQKNRIKGSEYATVYLGAMQSVMSQSLQFLLQQQQVDLQAQLIEKQIESEALNQLQIAEQTQNLVATRDQIVAQTAMAEQQTENLIAEALNIPKQGAAIDAEITVKEQQAVNLVTENNLTVAQTDQISAETLNVPKQGELIDSQNAVQIQQKLNLASENSRIEIQTANLTAEGLNIPKQGELIDSQVETQTAQKTQIEAQTSMTEQQTANAIIEGTVLTAQECKLSAEFDLINEQKLKTISETALLSQKKVTEQAQTTGAGISENSVIGKQIALYDGQKNGYVRDAEQKAAKLMVDTWNVRKTMDSTTIAGSADGVDTGNNLGDEKLVKPLVCCWMGSGRHHQHKQ